MRIETNIADLYSTGFELAWGGLSPFAQKSAQRAQAGLQEALGRFGIPDMTTFAARVIGGELAPEVVQDVLARVNYLRNILESGQGQADWRQLSVVGEVRAPGAISDICGVLPNGDIVANISSNSDVFHNSAVALREGIGEVQRSPHVPAFGVVSDGGVLIDSGVPSYVWYPEENNKMRKLHVVVGERISYTRARGVILSQHEDDITLSDVMTDTHTNVIPRESSWVFALGLTDNGILICENGEATGLVAVDPKDGETISKHEAQAHYYGGTAVVGLGVLLRDGGDIQFWDPWTNVSQPLEGVDQVRRGTQDKFRVVSNFGEPYLIAFLNYDGDHPTRISVVDTRDGKQIGDYAVPGVRLGTADDGRLLVCNGDSITILG